MATLFFFFGVRKFHFPHLTLSFISHQSEVTAREVYNWGLTVYTSRYAEALTAPHLFILNINENGRLGDPKDHPGHDCTADQIGPGKQGW